MKRGSTLFLKGVVIFLGLAALAVCVVLLPAALLTDKTGYYRPIIFGMYVPAVPFFIALYQAVKLLNLIDKNKAFSQASVKALTSIKYCGLAISGLYALGMPYIFYAANRDDAPGVVAIGLVIVFASLIIGIAAALFERLFQNAVLIKSENDLTV